MIIGDPYKFAVLFDRVKGWNASLSDNNGFFAVCVDGQMFPSTVVNAVIPTSLHEIKNSLIDVPVNEEIYNLETSEAFKALYKLVYPDGYDNNDYRYELSTSYLTDNDSLIFAVANKEKVKIFAAELEYDTEESCHIFDESALQEVILEKNEVNRTVIEIEEAISRFTSC